MVDRAARDAPSWTDATVGSAQLLRLGMERTDAILNIHEELLDAYCDASKTWLSRVQAEVEFWSELAGNLAASPSAPEGLRIYTASISQRLQMAADDGRRLFEEGQRITTAITRLQASPTKTT